jgi:hypothetical protein
MTLGPSASEILAEHFLGGRDDGDGPVPTRPVVRSPRNRTARSFRDHRNPHAETDPDDLDT